MPTVSDDNVQGGSVDRELVVEHVRLPVCLSFAWHLGIIFLNCFVLHAGGWRRGGDAGPLPRAHTARCAVRAQTGARARVCV